MSDSLGDGEGNATSAQARLYERWAEGGAALTLIGEAQVISDYPEKPGNLVLNDSVDQAALVELARRGSSEGTHIWPQLGHAGALAFQPLSKAKGPSALDVEGLQCDALSAEEVRDLPGIYAAAALVSQRAGFTGVQVHAGHGFLLSQFLSPLFNMREDGFGGSVADRFRIIGQIIAAVRQAVGRDYPIGIKINTTDSLVGGLTNEDALEVVKLLDETSVDLIELSGGTYFPGAASSSDSSATGGPYFLEFARRAKQRTTVPIVLTGGFRTCDEGLAVLEEGAADAIGLARALALAPELPTNWIRGDGTAPEFPQFSAPPKGSITAWYTMRLTALGNDAEVGFDMDAGESLKIYDRRDDERSVRWLKRFPVTGV